MNQQEKARLEKKSKMGWAAFYRSETKRNDDFLRQSAKIKDLMDNIKQRDIKGNSLEDSIPEFVQKEINDLYKELKKECECPICLEPLEKISFSSCGHKYCETCLSKIDKCAICRKKIYKKK